MTYSSGVVGAEERDKLISEGQALFSQVREEHFAKTRHTIYETASGKSYIPWLVEEEICIALALYARKKEKRDA